MISGRSFDDHTIVRISLVLSIVNYLASTNALQNNNKVNLSVQPKNIYEIFQNEKGESISRIKLRKKATTNLP